MSLECPSCLRPLPPVDPADPMPRTDAEALLLGVVDDLVRRSAPVTVRTVAARLTRAALTPRTREIVRRRLEAAVRAGLLTRTPLAPAAEGGIAPTEYALARPLPTV